MWANYKPLFWRCRNSRKQAWRQTTHNRWMAETHWQLWSLLVYRGLNETLLKYILNSEYVNKRIFSRLSHQKVPLENSSPLTPLRCWLPACWHCNSKLTHDSHSEDIDRIEDHALISWAYLNGRSLAMLFLLYSVCCYINTILELLHNLALRNQSG